MGRKRKPMTRKQYRTLAVIWTLAGASLAVAVVRQGFSLLLAGLFLLSMLTASNFWKCCKRAPEEGAPNQNSEEKDDE